MTLKKRLITSGCSFSSGYGLDDPQKAWPHILGQKLDLPVTNFAREGMGNDYIFSSIMDIADEDSLVVLGLTAYSRVEFINALKDKPFTTTLNYQTNKEFNKIFWKSYYDDEHYYKKFLVQLKLWDAYFKYNKIDYFLFDALPMNHYNKIDNPQYLWQGEKNMCDIIYPHKLDDGHPNSIAHEIIAEELYKLIKIVVQ